MLPVASCTLEKGFLRDDGIDWRNTRGNCALNHVHAVVHVIIGADIEIMSTLEDAFPLMLIMLDALCLTANDKDEESTATFLFAKELCSSLFEVKLRTAPFCLFHYQSLHYFTTS